MYLPETEEKENREYMQWSVRSICVEKEDSLFLIRALQLLRRGVEVREIVPQPVWWGPMPGEATGQSEHVCGAYGLAKKWAGPGTVKPISCKLGLSIS